MEQINLLDISLIGRIKSNTDKSKHLEAAVVLINGTHVDFLQLRNEDYAESNNSRIPTVSSETAEVDAFRRDITINSLFYNISTDKVEDFTGMGLREIKDGIIRTPLEPEKTFIDDPLRILRVIRFACRFDYKIESKILEAFRNEKIKSLLTTKVSKERIQIELDKILKHENGHLGMFLIVENKLVCEIFKIFDGEECSLKDCKIFYNNVLEYSNFTEDSILKRERLDKNKTKENNEELFVLNRKTAKRIAYEMQKIDYCCKNVDDNRSLPIKVLQKKLRDQQNDDSRDQDKKLMIIGKNPVFAPVNEQKTAIIGI